MKKVLLIGALVVVGLSSCRKNYDCDCTYDGVTYTVAEYIKVKKSTAELSCDSYDGSYWGECSLVEQ